VGKEHMLRALVRGGEAQADESVARSVPICSSHVVETGEPAAIMAMASPEVELAPGLRAFLGPWFGTHASPLTQVPVGSVVRPVGGGLMHDLGFDASSDESCVSSDE